MAGCGDHSLATSPPVSGAGSQQGRDDLLGDTGTDPSRPGGQKKGSAKGSVTGHTGGTGARGERPESRKGPPATESSSTSAAVRSLGGGSHPRVLVPGALVGPRWPGDQLPHTQQLEEGAHRSFPDPPPPENSYRRSVCGSGGRLPGPWAGAAEMALPLESSPSPRSTCPGCRCRHQRVRA